MVTIAGCESRFRQFGADGKALRGEHNEFDLGVMQINTLYHGKKADNLGYDLTSIGDNMAYARNLYEREGTKPWNSSSRCWNSAKKISKS